jgi:hypothetical protein
MLRDATDGLSSIERVNPVIQNWVFRGVRHFFLYRNGFLYSIVRKPTLG